MPNYYEISPTDDTLVLRNGKGSAGFTVRYVGDRAVEARVRAVPVEGAEQEWLNVQPPEQRDMQPGQTHTFKVTVSVPAQTLAGRYGLRLDVMSVDNTDEEYDQGPVVSFDVAEAATPESESSGFPWWVIIAASLVLAVFGGGAAWWFTADSGSGRITPVEEEVEPSEPAEEIAAPDRIDNFAVSQTWHGDLDRGREVPRGAPRNQADFWFRARTATDRSLVPRNGAQMRLMRTTRQAPTLTQVKEALEHGGSNAIDVGQLRRGRWVAVQTSAGGHAAFTVVRPVGPSPGELSVRYRYWKGERDERPVMGRVIEMQRLGKVSGDVR